MDPDDIDDQIKPTKTDDDETTPTASLAPTSSIVADCPICDRSEKFKDAKMSLARAWLTNHIITTHEDELPDP